MTYQIYSHQQLQLKSIARLKQIYSKIGCTVEVSDKRCKDAWISAIASRAPEAIANYQASKVQKLTLAAPDNQTLAQAELDNYIADQAQAVAPEPLRIVEISFGDHEYYAGDELIASISHDDNHLTQHWVVMVNGKEVFRANTLMRCDRFICTHYKDGTLPVQEQLATPCTTENQIMAHIFNECQNYNNSQLPIRNSQLHAMPKNRKLCTCNDSITNYVHNCELRTANCELLSNWWVKRRCSGQQQYSNSVFDAVRSLSMVDVSTDGKSIFDEYFLEQPLEQLTGDKLQYQFSLHHSNSETSF